MATIPMAFPRALAMSLVAALMLAGCSNGTETTTTSMVTCPSGQTVATNGTGNATDACPKPKPPTLTFGPIPDSVRVFAPATFMWTILPGDHEGGHSMLSSLRLAAVSQTDNSSFAGPDSYGKEIGKQEHQDLPANLSAEYTFTAPGIYYLRVYATILANDLESKEYWTPEVTLVVADVVPTGNVTVVTHAIGNSAGTLTPNPVDLKLGDGIILKNDDITPKVFTPDGAAACGTFTAAITVPSMASSETLVFKAPGTCKFTTDDVQKLTLAVNVSP